MKRNVKTPRREFNYRECAIRGFDLRTVIDSLPQAVLTHGLELDRDISLARSSPCLDNRVALSFSLAKPLTLPELLL